jgi:hypothetical protein
MIVARQFIAWTAVQKQPRPGGTHDSGRVRNCTDYAGEPDRISTVPLGRIISLTVPAFGAGYDHRSLRDKIRQAAWAVL